VLLILCAREMFNCEEVIQIGKNLSEAIEEDLVMGFLNVTFNEHPQLEF